MKFISKKTGGLLFTIVFTMVLASFNFEKRQVKPNFVFILTDDQSYGFMGCTGNKDVQTPNIDNLASSGTLFTNAHITSAICTPSRTSILLSQFERKHGVNFNSGTSVSDDAWKNAYPVVMREAGYYTGWVGKNHVPIGKGGYESGLMEKSFDYWYAGHGHLGFYPKKRHGIFDGAKFDTQVEVLEEGMVDFLTNEKKEILAKRFIETRPKDQPFMLSVCFNLPHGAGTGSMKMKDSDKEIYKSLYRDKQLKVSENYVAKENIKEPKLPLDIHHVSDRQTGYNYVDTPEKTIERYTRQIQAMTGIDLFVGQLRTTLKKEGLDKNTIIVFTSDHGLFMGEQGLGGKAFCYEQTTHVPMIVYNPSSTKKVRGIKSNALVQSIDIAPTLLKLAGIEIPKSYQGKEFTALLKGENEVHREFLFTENLWSNHFGNPRCDAIQNKKWKYIRYYKNENFSAVRKIETAKNLGIPVNKMLYGVHDGQIAIYRSYIDSPKMNEEAVYEELYDLSRDPNELNNIVGDPAYESQLALLKKEWAKAIEQARGSGKPEVYRYTMDSQTEKGVLMEPK
ncbi:MAG: sulfatase-like hydrolase/transferase [Reichenbachiella sp.]